MEYQSDTSPLDIYIYIIYFNFYIFLRDNTLRNQYWQQDQHPSMSWRTTTKKEKR